MLENNFKISISERKFFLRLFDVVFVFLGLNLLSFTFNFHYFNYSNPQLLMWLITLALYILFFGQIFEMYVLRVASDRFLTIRSVILTALFTTFFYVLTPILTPELPENRLQIIYLFLVIVTALFLWRIGYQILIFSPLFFKRLLLIGSTERIKNIVALINTHAQDNYIVGYVSNTENEQIKHDFFNLKNTNITTVVKKYQVSDIIIESDTIEKLPHISNQLIELFEEGYNITSIENYKEEITQCVPETRLNNHFYNHITFSKTYENRLYNAFHRLIDILIGFVGILSMLIVIPLVFLGNIIANRGPLFYIQTRVGKAGKLFTIFKFRTMVTHAEVEGAIWASKNDVRITKFGKFLRRSRIDEIPQFINILWGEMSLIGPRPERPEFVSKLNTQYALFNIRHVIKPGLTGWAQVMYPYASSYEDQLVKLRYDLYYIKERNVILDFKILTKTISTIIFLRGS